MLKTLTGIATAGVLALGAVVAAPQQAEARCVGCWVGAGIVGGAVVGAAIANNRYYYGGPGYAYYGGPGYAYGPGYASYASYGPGCWWRSKRVWTNHGWVVRRVQVCR